MMIFRVISYCRDRPGCCPSQSECLQPSSPSLRNARGEWLEGGEGGDRTSGHLHRRSQRLGSDVRTMTTKGAPSITALRSTQPIAIEGLVEGCQFDSNVASCCPSNGYSTA